MNVEEALAKLETEGDAKQIATYLRQQGCEGQTQSGVACPVANYLKRHVNEYVDVGTMYVSTRGGVVPGPGGGAFVTLHNTPLPENVQQFVSAFDAGEFPELDAERPADSNVQEG